MFMGRDAFPIWKEWTWKVPMTSDHRIIERKILWKKIPIRPLLLAEKRV